MAHLLDIVPGEGNGVLGAGLSELHPLVLGVVGGVNLAPSTGADAGKRPLASVDSHVVVKIHDDGSHGVDLEAGSLIFDVLVTSEEDWVSVVGGTLPVAGVEGGEGGGRTVFQKVEDGHLDWCFSILIINLTIFSLFKPHLETKKI